jgi:hypothetical protein
VSKFRRSTNLASAFVLTAVGAYAATFFCGANPVVAGWGVVEAGLPMMIGIIWLCSRTVPDTVQSPADPHSELIG